MKINWKERFSNYGLWVSLFSLIGLILVDTLNVDLGHYQQYVEIILTILMGLGIVNDPRKGKWYSDK